MLLITMAMFDSPTYHSHLFFQQINGFFWRLCLQEALQLKSQRFSKAAPLGCCLSLLNFNEANKIICYCFWWWFFCLWLILVLILIVSDAFHFFWLSSALALSHWTSAGIWQLTKEVRFGFSFNHMSGSIVWCTINPTIHLHTEVSSILLHGGQWLDEW